MPLDVVRLRDSDLAATESAESFRAAVMLWCASWHQLPAASLPNDDRVLANLAGYGRVVKEWLKERDGALRGWVLCSDGRWYHPVVAEKANEAWQGKLQHAYERLADRTRKANKARAERGEKLIDIPPIQQWISAGKPTEFPSESIGIPALNALKGKGQGKGQGQLSGIPDPNGSLPAAPQPSCPPCPVQQLVALFVARCTSLPKPRIELWKESQGAEAMRQRWKWLLSPETVRENGERYATSAAEAIEWFGLFFEKVEESDFLTGRAGRGKFDLAWLMKRENFMKVVQGNYENRGVPA